MQVAPISESASPSYSVPLWAAHFATNSCQSMLLELKAAEVCEPEWRTWLCQTVFGNGPLKEKIAPSYLPLRSFPFAPLTSLHMVDVICRELLNLGREQLCWLLKWQNFCTAIIEFYCFNNVTIFPPRVPRRRLWQPKHDKTWSYHFFALCTTSCQLH